MSEPKITIPFSRCSEDGKTYTALQMTKELYAYKKRWKGFQCPVRGCDRHLKWTHCSVRGKFWSHKHPKRGESQGHGGVAHSGETWEHIQAKAKVVDRLKDIEFYGKKCPDCERHEKYLFDEANFTAKAEHPILKGIRADVAVFNDEKLVAAISIVHSHQREPEKWQKIYDQLGILLFEFSAQRIMSQYFLMEEDRKDSLWSNIYVHWGRCPQCTKEEEDRQALRDMEPELVVDDGRHLNELSDSELNEFWQKHHKKKNKKIEKVESILRSKNVCYRCTAVTTDGLCEKCKLHVTSTRCDMCGAKTMTTWRTHCLPCCKIINSTNCQRCNAPTHSSWKKHCKSCYFELKEEEGRKDCKRCGQKIITSGEICIDCWREQLQEQNEEMKKKNDNMSWIIEQAMEAEKERRREEEGEERRREEELRRRREEEERRREEEQRRRDIAWKKREKEIRRKELDQRMKEIEQEEKDKEEERLRWKRIREQKAKRKVQEMEEEELQAKLKQQAKKRQKEKAKKKRQEEKELKVYKETNQGYQKMINDNRVDYGLPKKKVQKTMASFFMK